MISSVRLVFATTLLSLSMTAASGQFVPAGDSPALGDPSAAVTVVEFSDYGCPFCRLHFLNTFPELKRDYVDTGKVRYVYRDFPQQPQAQGTSRTAEAARCAGEQGRFWEMHRELYASRRASGTDELRRIARTLPLDAAEFDACLADGTYTRAVRLDYEEGRRLGVTGTPTFFIGRSGPDGAGAARLVGARPVGDFRLLIDRLLASDHGRRGDLAEDRPQERERAPD